VRRTVARKHLPGVTSALALAVLLASAGPVPVRLAPGALHGFPSLADEAGKVIADGELSQELRGEVLRVHLRWAFADGRRVEERAEFRVGAHLTQTRFSWVETAGEVEVRRFEVDFTDGRATAAVRGGGGEPERHDTRLDLPDARAFTGYGTALAVSQLELPDGGEAELTFVAFTPKPRTVTLAVRRRGEERIEAHGRSIRCDRFVLHPKIPFPVSLFARARDAHLWFTHDPPAALVRAEQNLVEKDDPVVVVDVIPRGKARATESARTPEGRGRAGTRR
jgi:hypothetical protein